MNPCELTPRQCEVLDGMHAGHTNKQMARNMGVSPRTIEIHRAHAMRVLGASTAAQAILIWHERKRAFTAPATAPAAATLSQRPIFKVWHDGTTITRNGDYFATLDNPELAQALALILTAGQFILTPALAPDLQQWACQTL